MKTPTIQDRRYTHDTRPSPSQDSGTTLYPKKENVVMLDKRKMLVYFGVLVVGTIILAACGAQATATATTAPAATPTPSQPTLTMPFKDTFLSSGHANATDEPFTHWNDASPAVVPAACARCHTSSGFQDFVANGKASDVPAPAGTLDCVTCHNPAAMALTSV